MSAAEVLSGHTLDGSYLGYGSVSETTFNLAVQVVDRSGVAALLDEYRREDSAGRWAGGRPLAVPRHAALVLMFIVVLERGRSLHATTAAEMAGSRLTADQRERLGLPRWSGLESKKVWIDRVLASLDSTFRLIDPYWVANRRERYLKTEWDDIVASRDPDFVEQRMDRLYTVMNRLVQASTECLPWKWRAKFKGHRAVDGTSWRTSARGTTGGSKWRSVEPNAYWYRRDGDHQVTEGLNVSVGSGLKKFHGYEATLFCWTKDKKGDPDDYPFLVDAIGFNPPGKAPDEVTVRAARTIKNAGLPINVLRADKQYWVGLAKKSFHYPMWEMGFEACTDLKKDQYGLEGDPVHGMVRIEGDYYCQSILASKALVTASADYNAGTITKAQHAERIAARATYLITDKQRPDANGKRVLQCPAVRGLVDCPVKADRLPAPPMSALPLFNVTSAGKVCDNTASVSVTPEHRSRYEQKYRLGTPEWFAAMGQRSIVESYNKDLKETAIGSKSGFRLRGYAANYLLVTLSAMSVNVHRINNFLASKRNEKSRRGRKPSVMPFSSAALAAAKAAEKVGTDVESTTNFDLPLSPSLSTEPPDGD